MNGVGEHVQYFGENELKHVPLNQECVAAHESISLGLEQLLGLLFFFSPLKAIVLFVKGVGHDVDSEEQAIAKDEAVWVEVLLIAVAGFEPEIGYEEENSMHRSEDGHDRIPLLRVLDVDIAYEHVQDAEATVVRGSLQEEQWRDLFGSELVDSDSRDKKAVEDKKQLCGLAHRKTSLAPLICGMQADIDCEKGLHDDEYLFRSGKHSLVNFLLLCCQQHIINR